MIGPFALAVLDMAGTTVRDDGAVDEAFTSALSSVGIGVDDPRFASAQAYVRDTMGQSKADVFAALLEPDDAARATDEFARAYERIVAEGRVAPMEGAAEVFAALRARGREGVPDHRVRAEHPRCVARRIGLGGARGPGALPGRLRPGTAGARHDPRRHGAPGRPDAGAVAVVGDTTSDLEAGTNAGARAVIGVLSGAHDRKALSAAPHTDLIDDVTGLIGVLSRR